MAKPAGNRQAKQTKPKCGAGQSCGFACIAAHKTCTEKLSDTISKAAVKAAISHRGSAARHLILEPGVAALVAMALAEKDDLGFLRDAAVDTTVES